jgi:hypothetical protein
LTPPVALPMILLLKQNPGRQPVELFAKLFDSLLVFVYHCFDRIVINGYLSGLSRPEQVVHFVRHVLGIPLVSKEVLRRRTEDYRDWLEAYARNQLIPIEWAEKGLRKEDYVLPALHRLERRNAFGVYFIFRSMEQGRTFRITVRLTKKLPGKLATVIEQIDHGHHVFRVNFKNALLRQYEKFSRFLRNELLSNNLTDFGLRRQDSITSTPCVRSSALSPIVLPTFRLNL